MRGKMVGWSQPPALADRVMATPLCEMAMVIFSEPTVFLGQFNHTSPKSSARQMRLQHSINSCPYCLGQHVVSCGIGKYKKVSSAAH
ncbi:hypothetical protein RRG08_058759 [Elysia crispata]|uniref:Uncharacterized protein n=1 Tax=Elysia crispata TaxID=231223 RepID=A0AAE1D5V0_9GAST|nr:hypothetical protein RRG08_058759 [Elysia crispata]